MLEDPRLRRDSVSFPRRDNYVKRTMLSTKIHPDLKLILVPMSKRTGMTVVLAPAESPIVNGYLCLATEAFNDDGLPHTLEHLIFLGR